MLIATRTYSSDEEDNEDYDFMVVHIEEFEAKTLHSYFSLFDATKKSQPSLLEMTFSVDDVESEFFRITMWGEDGEDSIPEEVLSQLDEQNWAIIPDEMEVPFEPKYALAPTNAYLVVCEQGVFWRAYPHDGSLQIDSVTLPREVLTRVL